jgi:glycosyltransferase involved in cell wall biosynthesis
MGKMTKPKNKFIVMLGTSPEARGGIATVVKNYQESGLLAEWGVQYITTHVQASLLTKLHVAFKALFRLVGMLLRNRVALVHVHMSVRGSTRRKLFYALLAMLYRVPVLLHIHVGSYARFFTHDCGNIERWLIRFLLRHASRVIVLSAACCSDIRSIEPDAKTVVLWNTVPLPDLENRAVLQGASHAIGILFLGLVGQSKGVFDLIHATSLLRGNFLLTICGEGEIDIARKLVTSLGLEGKVVFPGWVRGNEKDELFARTRIFVLPSYDEGVPIVVLEAMSWAVPVVATLVGGTPEIVSHGIEGLLVTPGNIQELALALEQLLADPERCQKMGAAGRVRVERDFCAKVIYPQLEKLWLEAGALPLNKSERDL